MNPISEKIDKYLKEGYGDPTRAEDWVDKDTNHLEYKRGVEAHKAKQSYDSNPHTKIKLKWKITPTGYDKESLKHAINQGQWAAGWMDSKNNSK